MDIIKVMFKKSKKGFTLIELLIVVAIIGVLSALLMVNFIGVRQRARDAQRKSDLRQIQSALEIYRSDNSVYPALGSCGSALTGGAPASTYMQKIPCDPLGGDYTYALVGTTGYTIRACLENSADSGKDAVNTCTGQRYSYTLQNP